MWSQAEIRQKIDNLVRLAERPGTPQEGATAREAAIRLSLKYGIACKFVPRPGGYNPPQPQTNGGFQQQQKPQPPKQQPPPIPKMTPEEMLKLWTQSLQNYGWKVQETIGQQVRFRHGTRASEIRLTQRRTNTGNCVILAEHVMAPDKNAQGYDMSWTVYETIHLRDLMWHLGTYEAVPWYEGGGGPPRRYI